MESRTLNLKLLDQSNSLSNSDESSVFDQLEDTAENKCGSICHKKIQLLLQNAVLYEKERKDLEIQLAKLEVKVSSYPEQIRDNAVAIAALKDQLAASLKETDKLLKESEFKINQLQSLTNIDSMNIKEKDALLSGMRDKINQYEADLKEKTERLTILENKRMERKKFIFILLAFVLIGFLMKFTAPVSFPEVLFAISALLGLKVLGNFVFDAIKREIT